MNNMTLKVEFETDNSDFDGNLEGMTSDILAEIAGNIRDGIRAGTIRDTDGNCIGSYLLK